MIVQIGCVFLGFLCLFVFSIFHPGRPEKEPAQASGLGCHGYLTSRCLGGAGLVRATSTAKLVEHDGNDLEGCGEKKGNSWYGDMIRQETWKPGSVRKKSNVDLSFFLQD